mmetsp:Transcript_30743/g.99449  ORF Transcript_30743/g.99449 Transcript_30743/m.99449 type:complete len:283 (+) Transcript_30743:202-1050(+)|eukprot:scaffold2236_cov136-Isochrysis_galbana.AAC.7
MVGRGWLMDGRTATGISIEDGAGRIPDHAADAAGSTLDASQLPSWGACSRVSNGNSWSDRTVSSGGVYTGSGGGWGWSGLGGSGMSPSTMERRSVWRARRLTWNWARENARTLRNRSRCERSRDTSGGRSCATCARDLAPSVRLATRRPALLAMPCFCTPAARGGMAATGVGPRSDLIVTRTCPARIGESCGAELSVCSTRHRANFTNAPASGFAPRRPSGFSASFSGERGRALPLRIPLRALRALSSASRMAADVASGTEQWPTCITSSSSIPYLPAPAGS